MSSKGNTAMRDHCIANGIVDHPPMLVYVEKPRLYVAVINNAIYKIEKAYRNEKINPHATVVETFDLTTAAIEISNDRLCLDGFALTDVMAWLYRRMPKATDKAFELALMKLFPNCTDYSEITRAVCRVVLGIEHTAPGDAAYFCAKVREAHPAEFAMLIAAWKEHHGGNPDGAVVN